MRRKEKLLGGLFSFFIAFFLFLLLFICVSKATLLNKGFLLSTLDKSEYYTGVTRALTEDFKKSAGAAGFQPSVYDGFLKEADVKKAAIQYIETSFTGKEAAVDQESFKKQLNDHLQKVIKTENIKLDEDSKLRLENYIKVNAKGYKQFVQFPFIQYIVMGIQMMDRVLPFAHCSVCVIAAAFCVFSNTYEIEKEGYPSVSWKCGRRGRMDADIASCRYIAGRLYASDTSGAGILL